MCAFFQSRSGLYRSSERLYSTTDFLKAAHSSGTSPGMVGVTVGSGTETFSKKGRAFGAMADGGNGSILGEGVFLSMYDKGVAVGGGSPKAAAVVGRGGPLEGGCMGGVELSQEECPELPRVAVVESTCEHRE